MKLTVINKTIAILIILTNVYFVHLNIITIKRTGEFQLIITTSLLLITAGLTFINKFKNSFLLLSINGLGLMWNLLLLWLALTTPQMD